MEIQDGEGACDMPHVLDQLFSTKLAVLSKNIRTVILSSETIILGPESGSHSIFSTSFIQTKDRNVGISLLGPEMDGYGLDGGHEFCLRHRRLRVTSDFDTDSDEPRASP